jgi:hypothetical protein
MELVEIEGNLSACRSRIAALKAETRVGLFYDNFKNA